MELIMLWLVLLILFVGVEAATLGLASIWFAGGSLVAMVAAILNAPLYVQIILFFVVSMVLLFFTRPLAVKYFNKDRVRTNVESMVGRQGVVTSAIDNLQGIGQVTVGGLEWSARSFDDITLTVGSVVEIKAISGVKLIVSKQEMEHAEGEPETVPVQEQIP